MSQGPSDPPRLLESAAPALCDALKAARADLPSADRLAALSAKIEAATTGGPSDPSGGGANEAGAGASQGGAASGSGAVFAALVKPALIALMGVAVATLVVTLLPSAPASPPKPILPSVQPTSAAPTPSGPALVPAVEDTGSDHVKDAEVPALSQAEVAENAEPRPARRATQPSGPLPSELDLLLEAKRALGEEPSQALERLERHARLYPRGMLSEEREALAIDALRRLGRKVALQRRAARFLSLYPSSPHAANVRRMASMDESDQNTAPPSTRIQ